MWTKKTHSVDKKTGRLRRLSGLGTSRPFRIWVGFRPGPESEFDLAERLGSFYCPRGHKRWFIWPSLLCNA